MDDITSYTVEQMHNGLKSGQFSSVDLTKAHIDKISNSKLNAFVLQDPKTSLEQAEEADLQISKGNISTLTGIPIGIKDNFCTKGMRTTACSKILSNFIPTYESTITQRLFDKGAVNLGKLNMDEFAMGSANMFSSFGPAINPWVRKDGAQVVPGGSSGGSAAAVAAGLCPIALGSDTGGSVRQPASFCGIVGVKPTYGVCPRTGLIAFASSLDQAGCLARNVKDAAIMLDTISGYDPKDSTSYNAKHTNCYANINNNVKEMTIGIPTDKILQELGDEIAQSWILARKLLEEAGAKIKEISLPNMESGLPSYYIIAPAEASSNLARYDGIRYGLRIDADTPEDLYELTRSEGFGHEVKKRILMGTYVLSAGHYDAFYCTAQRVRRVVSQDFAKAFEDVDVILTPTTPTEAFAVNEQPKGLDMYLNDILTVCVNLAGLPSISLPISLSKSGLPLGMQIIANHYQEQKLFDAALALEERACFTGLI